MRTRSATVGGVSVTVDTVSSVTAERARCEIVTAEIAARPLTWQQGCSRWAPEGEGHETLDRLDERPGTGGRMLEPIGERRQQCRAAHRRNGTPRSDDRQRRYRARDG